MSLMIALLLQLLAPLGAPSYTASDVVVVVWDDVALEDVQTIPTPNLDQLAAEGTSFSEAYASPLCQQARRTLMLGRYTRQKSGAPCNPGGDPVLDPPHDEYGFAKMVTGTGAKIAGFGKYHYGSTYVPGMPWEASASIHGFNTWRAGVPGNVAVNCGGSSYTNWLRWDDGVSSFETLHQSIAMRDEFLIWWQATSGRRVAYLAFQQAHSPFHVPPASIHPQGCPGGSDNRGKFECMVESLDFMLGEVLATVGPQAVVIVIGDNGTPKGAAPDPDRAKWTTYQRGINVPLVIRAPGGVQGQVSGALVGIVDIMGTVGDYLGAAPPAYGTSGMDSCSLRGIVEGTQTSVRNFLYSGADIPNAPAPETPDRAVIYRDAQGTTWKMRDLGWGSTEEFYNLDLDPQETDPNAAGAPAGTLRALMGGFTG